MAVFKGGPALPKRSDTMTVDTSDAVSNLTKRKQRTTSILSNPLQDVETQHPTQAMFMDEEEEDDNDDEAESSTVAADDEYMEEEEQQTKPNLLAERGETSIPTSNIRSTSHKPTAPLSAPKKELMEDDTDASEYEPKQEKLRKTMESDDVKTPPPMPTTPKKGKRASGVTSSSNSSKVASSSKDVMRTPTKKQTTSAPTTPSQQAPLASAWQAEHWNDLNFAILKVVHDHAAELYEASPGLTPWKIKGRLLVKLRQLLKEAHGGEVASKRWDVELKPIRNKGGSPKKQQ